MVLFHNTNRFPSFSFSHAANMKESFESMKLLLEKIKCNEFNWKLRGDVKVVAVTRNATWVHKILMFLVQVGQPGREESLCK